MRERIHSNKPTARLRRAITRKTRKQYQGQDSAFGRPIAESHSGRQSADLQGLRDIESADSESIDELLEEGNAFEAEIVAGVEQADAADADLEGEVHSHELPEDDVPGEYLDKD